MKIIDEVQQALVQSTITTFSDMAFIDVVDLPRGSEKVPTGQLVHIGFTSPLEGQIILYLPTPLKQMVVENIFGMKWEDVDSGEFDDCLLEISNVLAGNFLKILGVSEEKHDISLPELIFDDLDMNNSDFNDYCFDAEGIPFQVSIDCWERSHNKGGDTK